MRADVPRVVLLLLGERRELGRLGEHPERAVGREVEDVAVLLEHPDAALLEHVGRLRPEDRLHVGRGRRVLRALQVEDRRPLGHRHARREASAGERDGVRLASAMRDLPPELVEGVVARLVVVAVAGDVDDRELTEDLVFLEQLFERLRLPHAGEDPQRVVEREPVGVRRERVVGGGAVLAQLVQKHLHPVLMDEPSLLGGGHPRAAFRLEELRERERGVLPDDELSEVIGEDVHARQRQVGVGPTGRIPIVLRRLLVDVVPGVDLAVVELVGQVERRAGEVEHLRLRLRKKREHVLSALGLCALVSLVDDHHVPRELEDVALLLFRVHAADGLRESEVLQGDEVDTVAVGLLREGGQFREAEALFLLYRAGAESVSLVGREEVFLQGLQAVVVEDLGEVVAPALVDDGTVGDDEGRLGVEPARELEGADRLAEAHLGVPEELAGRARLGEVLAGAADRLVLLVAEGDLVSVRRQVSADLYVRGKHLFLLVVHLEPPKTFSNSIFCRSRGFVQSRITHLTPLCPVSAPFAHAGHSRDFAASKKSICASVSSWQL